jgi:hypothetical protein
MSSRALAGAPKSLSALRRIAKCESICSSTRIESSKLPDHEVERLFSNLEIKSFATRDEQEAVQLAQKRDRTEQTRLLSLNSPDPGEDPDRGPKLATWVLFSFAHCSSK